VIAGVPLTLRRVCGTGLGHLGQPRRAIRGTPIVPALPNRRDRPQRSLCVDLRKEDSWAHREQMTHGPHRPTRVPDTRLGAPWFACVELANNVGMNQSGTQAPTRPSFARCIGLKEAAGRRACRCGTPLVGRQRKWRSPCRPMSGSARAEQASPNELTVRPGSPVGYRPISSVHERWGGGARRARRPRHRARPWSLRPPIAVPQAHPGT
jgi:hypothetical protein